MANTEGICCPYRSAAGANAAVVLSTATHTRARPSQRPLAIDAARPDDPSIRKRLLVLIGVARLTYHAERQANAYTRTSGSSSASASSQLSPSRVNTAASRTQTISQAARYAASRSTRPRIGCTSDVLRCHQFLISTPLIITKPRSTRRADGLAGVLVLSSMPPMNGVTSTITVHVSGTM